MEVVSNIASIVLVNTVLPSLDACVVPPVYGKGVGGAEKWGGAEKIKFLKP